VLADLRGKGPRVYLKMLARMGDEYVKLHIRLCISRFSADCCVFSDLKKIKYVCGHDRMNQFRPSSMQCSKDHKARRPSLDCWVLVGLVCQATDSNTHKWLCCENLPKLFRTTCRHPRVLLLLWSLGHATPGNHFYFPGASYVREASRKVYVALGSSSNDGGHRVDWLGQRVPTSHRPRAAHFRHVRQVGRITV
jgi:hypothetical protein